MPVSCWMRRSGQPSRPSAMTCCRFSSLKTLLTSMEGNPSVVLNVLPISIGRFSAVPHWPVLGVPRRARAPKITCWSRGAGASRPSYEYYSEELSNLTGIKAPPPVWEEAVFSIARFGYAMGIPAPDTRRHGLHGTGLPKPRLDQPDFDQHFYLVLNGTGYSWTVACTSTSTALTAHS